MATISPTDLLAQLNWRYATKQFDPSRKISDETWAALQAAIRLSPSSFGLEPWLFVDVRDAQVRAQLRPVSWGQSQITDASHLLVFAVKRKMTEADVDEHIARVAGTRGASVEQLAPLRNVIVGDVVNGPRSKVVEEWAARQAYIALGNAMAAAALLGVDTCPIEGFEPERYDAILNLTEKGLASKVVLTLGYRSAQDKYGSMAKVRKPLEQVFVRVG